MANGFGKMRCWGSPAAELAFRINAPSPRVLSLNPNPVRAVNPGLRMGEGREKFFGYQRLPALPTVTETNWWITGADEALSAEAGDQARTRVAVCLDRTLTTASTGASRKGRGGRKGGEG